MASSRPALAVSSLDEVIDELVRQTDHKALATWALDCAERVLHYFEDEYPRDGRPRRAIAAGRDWVKTGDFKMAVIRKAALDSHAAARAAKDDDPARPAARAAGQGLATAHVRTHSIAAARYAASAVRDAADPIDDDAANAAVEKERQWQYRHLLELRKAK
ncbi:MAG: putative immunity protein [Candidatus Geothermincolia bacterium]